MGNDELIQNIRAAERLLKEGNLLVSSVNGLRTYFAKKKDRVFIQNDSCCFSVTFDEFLTLYGNCRFLLYAVSGDGGIDPKKDEEYYTWDVLKY